MAWLYLLIFFLVAAVGCCVGFKNFVYFLSVGYGFAVLLLGVAIPVALIAGGYSWNWVTLLQCILFVAYGARLSLFLIFRERKSKGYQKVMKSNSESGGKKMPIFVKVIIWLSVSVLYVMQTCPVFYRGYNYQGYEVALPLVGALLSCCGLCLEALSDRQKSAQKAKRPDMVATEGLFKMSRCPNYFGEILFWTGVFVGALNALKGGQWVLAILGYICIVYVMVDGAKRLDVRQQRNYGDKQEFRDYADHTPIILPLIPVYHLSTPEKEDAKKAARDAKKAAKSGKDDAAE